MINLEEFVTKLKAQFVDVDTIDFSPETKFKDIPSWDSLTGMAVVVMVNEEFKIDLPDSALKESDTIEELYNYIKSK